MGLLRTVKEHIIYLGCFALWQFIQLYVHIVSFIKFYLETEVNLHG